MIERRHVATLLIGLAALLLAACGSQGIEAPESDTPSAPDGETPATEPSDGTANTEPSASEPSPEPAGPGGADNKLAGTQWQLVAFGPESRQDVEGATVTLSFTGDRAEGNGGCNGYSGTYQVDGDQISFNDITGTMMACADEQVTQQEQAYLGALQRADTFELQNDHLLITYGDEEGVLRFEAASSAQPTPDAGASDGEPVELVTATPSAPADGEGEATPEGEGRAATPTPSGEAEPEATQTTRGAGNDTPSSASGPAYDRRDGPFALLASYYNAINRGEYERAYSYWDNPPQSFEQFKQGFAQTAAVAFLVHPPPFVEGTAGRAMASVPVMLLATSTDVSQETFVGCVTTSRPSPGAAGHPTDWSIAEATIDPVSENRTDATPLMQGCEALYPDYPDVEYHERSTPVALLASYYNAINNEDYQRAYGYWRNPSQSFEAFKEGFAETESVALIVRQPPRLSAATGNVYAELPVMLLADQSDGSRQSFVGCITLWRANVTEEREWALQAAELEPAGDTTDVSLIPQYCGQ